MLLQAKLFVLLALQVPFHLQVRILVRLAVMVPMVQQSASRLQLVQDYAMRAIIVQRDLFHHMHQCALLALILSKVPVHVHLVLLVPMVMVLWAALPLQLVQDCVMKAIGVLQDLRTR
jgi:hypothetical protein